MTLLFPVYVVGYQHDVLNVILYSALFCIIHFIHDKIVSRVISGGARPHPATMPLPWHISRPVEVRTLSWPGCESRA